MKACTIESWLFLNMEDFRKDTGLTPTKFYRQRAKFHRDHRVLLLEKEREKKVKAYPIY